MRFYELAEEYRRVDALLDESGGEVTPELQARLDAIEGLGARKADAIGALVRERTAKADAYAAEAKRLADRAAAERNAAESLKSYARSCLEAAGLDSIKGDTFALRIQRNGRPSIRWTRDLADCPPEFLRVTAELDGQKAIEAYRAGGLPEGFEATVGRHLRVV